MEKRKSNYNQSRAIPPQPVKRPVLTEEQLSELREIFDIFCCPDANGKADLKEMRIAAQTLGMKH